MKTVEDDGSQLRLGSHGNRPSLATQSSYAKAVVDRESGAGNAEENAYYLRIYVQHLGRKLGDDPLLPKYIITETGIGYRLKESP